MFNKRYVVVAILSAGLLMFGSRAVATDIPGELCEYKLTSADGRAQIKIFGKFLQIKITEAPPKTLYTIWIDFRSRARLALDPDNPIAALDDDYQLLIAQGKNPLPRGVAPAFATTAGVTAGMGLDPNGVITDQDGKAVYRAILDYDLLERGGTPVVGAELAMQGQNRVGGYWLRKYPEVPTVGASLQLTDPEDGLPLLERATPQGITIVRHVDFVTHGHTPGVGGVDHSSAFKGDFPADCVLP